MQCTYEKCLELPVTANNCNWEENVRYTEVKCTVPTAFSHQLVEDLMYPSAIGPFPKLEMQHNG